MLEEKEEKSEKRIELSEEEAQLLNEKLMSLRKGDFVSVTYYEMIRTGAESRGRYSTQSGILTGISCELKTIRVRNTVIPVPDICRIEKCPQASA